MNEDVKKSLRTQGKYSGGPNNRDKQQKESPVNKEHNGTKSHARKRNSNGQKEEDSSFTGVAEDKSIKHQRKSTHSPIRFPEDDSNSSSIKYQDNSPYSFNELEVQKFTEIRTSGIHTLSETDNGPSTIFYEPNFIEAKEAQELLLNLHDTVCWKQKNITIRGSEYLQPRLVAWYGPLPYTYSGATLEPAEMPKSILHIKDRIEDYLFSKGVEVSFNSVLLNLYRNGRDSVSWHSDDEILLAVCPTIGSISLGETRRFEMRRKVNSYDEDVSDDEVEKCFIKLTHGSLLIMTDYMQLDWQHRIPKEYHDKDMRINLTFRTVYPLDSIPKIMFKDGKKPYEKCSNQDAPTNSKMNFNEDDFPPLSSTLKTDSLDTEENKNIISPSSNLSSRNNDTKESIECGSLDTKECEDIICPNSDVSSKNNGTSKSIECVSDDLLSHTHMSNTEYWDSELVNGLKGNWEKNEYDMAKTNINLGDNFIHNSDIACADNSTKRDQSFNSIMHASSEHTYTEPPIPAAPINNAQETCHYAADNSISNLKSNSILNVEAREFVPTISPIPTKLNYDTLDIKQLLEYNIKAINDDELREYSYALRKRNMDYNVEFEYFDNLNFLNELMEETQSLRTQRLITERMHKLLCEFFDELDYSGNSPKLRGSYSGREQYNQRGNDNFHMGESNVRDPNSNRNEIYYRNKRQNNRREQPNRKEIFSREDYSSRDIQRNKNSNREDNFSRESFPKGKGNRNFNREGYFSYDKFSSVEKQNFNSKKYSGKENKNFNREDCSQRDFSDIRKRDSNEKNFNEDDSSDWTKIDSNIEKDYNQEEMPSRDDKIGRNFNGARRNNGGRFASGRRGNAGRGAFFSGRGRNASREDFSNRRRKDSSRGGEYSSQEEFTNKRENRSSQEENSGILPPRFSNRGEKSSGKGYSKNRKESLTQEKEDVAQQ